MVAVTELPYKTEGPRSIALNGPSNPVSFRRENRVETILTQSQLVYTTLHADRRCPDSDRDCFDGGRGSVKQGRSLILARTPPLAHPQSSFRRRVLVVHSPVPRNRKRSAIRPARRGARWPVLAGVRSRILPPPDKRTGATSITENIKGTSGFNAITETARYPFSWEIYNDV